MLGSARKRWQKVLCARLACIVSLIAVMLSVAEAHASVAPMCDEAGASAPAPIPALPNQTGELRAFSSCRGTSVALSVPAEERPSVDLNIQWSQRALPGSLAWAAPRGVGQPAPAAERLVMPVGFGRSIYRPPRA